MKDLVTKATFGFLMAQLFPGAIAFFAGAFVYFALGKDLPDGVLATASFVLRECTSAPLGGQVVLLCFCIGAGMFIHGLHWATLGALEIRFESVFDSYWHDRRLVWQVLLGPIKLVRETGELFFLTQHIRKASISENVCEINSSQIKQFEFIEDFYLYSAQFFAHTAYAISAWLVADLAYVAAYGPRFWRLALLVAAYVTVGLFFVLGRIQLRTMFFAESELANRATCGRAPGEAGAPGGGAA